MNEGMNLSVKRLISLNFTNLPPTPFSSECPKNHQKMS